MEMSQFKTQRPMAKVARAANCLDGMRRRFPKTLASLRLSQKNEDVGQSLEKERQSEPSGVKMESLERR
jgi:hypothetical protein